MSLPPESLTPIPETTARVAHRAFPKGSLAIQLRDVLGTIYHDGMFADLFSELGQPALAPWRLALVTVLQYAENLTDAQAADAVRGRIDWKYALSLPLDDEGFHASGLSTFRERLARGDAAERLLWALIEQCRERGWLRERSHQRTDSTRVLAAIRTVNRLELVGETLRAALEALALSAPDWLQTQVDAGWAERYGRRIEAARLPAGEAKRQAYAQEVGRDGATPLAAVQASTAPAWLREIAPIQVLERVWAQQYRSQGETVRFRQAEELPPSSALIQSPYDPEARWSTKREEGWVGYKAHLTETCADASPHLVIDVQSTIAAVDDHAITQPLWETLATQALLPDEHYMDSGYVDASHVVRAQEHAITVIGPVQISSGWQQRMQTGYSQEHFQIDWDAQSVRCPHGATSSTWRPSTMRGQPVIQVHFRAADCGRCPARERCTTGKRRALALLPQPAYAARQAILARQTTPAFRAQYARRAGIEGTISQAVRRFGLRRARYRGLDKVHIQHCAEATALNVVRLLDWHADKPRGRTRQTHLTRLLSQAA